MRTSVGGDDALATPQLLVCGNTIFNGFEMKVRRILYVQYTNAAFYPPLEHSSRFLADRGWNVLFLGIDMREGNVQFPAHPGIRVKSLGYVNDGWKQKLQYVFYCFWTLYWTWRWRPEWIYASDASACPIVWLVQRVGRVRVLYHEHDSPTEGQESSWLMRMVLKYRRKIGRDAELCVFPQHERLLEFLKLTRRSRPAFCVWNCPPLREVLDFGSSQERSLVIYYHGSITSSRLPAQLIVAASRFKGAVRLRVAGYETAGSIGYVKELKKLSAENGVTDLIEFIGALPHSHLLRYTAECHVGLSLMPKESKDFNMQHMVGASNKSFECMASGLPLLVSELPDWISTFVEPGYARACDPDDPNSIEAELRWYLDHPDERRAMGRRCRNKIRQAWNYDTMFASVLENLESG